MANIKPLTKEQSEELSPITDAVVNALTKKAMYEMRQCNRDNPTTLGGVTFYFDQTSPKGPYLVWNKHPREWNETLIKEDVDNLEHHFLKLRGLVE